MEGDEFGPHPIFKDWGVGGMTVVTREDYFRLLQILGLDPTRTVSVHLTPTSIDAEVLDISAHEGPKSRHMRIPVR